MNEERSLTFEDIQTNIDALIRDVHDINEYLNHTKESKESSNLKKFANDCDNIINKCGNLIAQFEKKIVEKITCTQILDESCDIKPLGVNVIALLNKMLNSSKEVLELFKEAKEARSNDIYAAKGRFQSALDLLQDMSMKTVCSILKKIGRISKFRYII
jgi:hypothetical protein